MFKNQTFGAPSTGFGSFNANATTASPFSGFKPTASTSAFGAPPAFGANATPQATTGGGLFGSTNTTGGLFGNTTTPSTFGQSSGFGFGANTSGGGLFSNNAGTGLFAGNQNTSSFGAKPSGFGFGSNTTTGTTGGLFGSTPSTSTGLFGQQNTTLGGTGLFGNTAGGFGQQAATGTAHVKYNPVVGTDVIVKSGTSQNVNIKHHCITCMKEYETKSLEELRLEDYAAGRKGAPGGMFGGFQQTENKPLFGGSNMTFGQPATTSAPSLFGGGIGSTSGFGQTSQYPYQNMRKHASMPTHPCISQCRFNFNCNAPKFCSAHACTLAGDMHVCTCPCRSKLFIDPEKCLSSGTKIHTCMLRNQMFFNNLCNKTDSFNEGSLTLVHNSFLGAKMSLELANSTFDATMKTFDYCSGKIMFAREYTLLRVLFNNSKEALDYAKRSFAMASRAYDISNCQRNNGIGRLGAVSFMFTNANKTLEDVDVHIKNVSNDFQSRHFYNAPTLSTLRTAFNSVKSALNYAKNALETAARDLGVDKLFPLDFTSSDRNYKFTFGMPFNSYGAALNNSSTGFTFFGTGINSQGPKFQTQGTAFDSTFTSCNSFGSAPSSSEGEVKTSAFDTSNTNAFGTAFNSAYAEMDSVGTAFNSSNAGLNSDDMKDVSSSKNSFNSADTGFEGTSTSFNLSEFNLRSDQKFSDSAMRFGNTDKIASDSAMKFCDNKKSNDTGLHFGDNEKKTTYIKFGDTSKKSSDNSAHMKFGDINKVSSNTGLFGNTNKEPSDTGMKFDNTGMKFCERDKKCIDTDMEVGNSAKKFLSSDMKARDMKSDDIYKKSSVNSSQFGVFSVNFGDTEQISGYTGIKYGNTNKQIRYPRIRLGGTECIDGGKNFGSPVKFGDTNKISCNTGMKFGNTDKQPGCIGMHFGFPDQICIDPSFKFGIGEFKNTSPIGAPKSGESDDEISGLANIGSKFDNTGASSTDKTKLIGTSSTLDTTGPEIDIALLKLKDIAIQVSDTDIKLDDIDTKFRDTGIKFVSVSKSGEIGIKFGTSGVTNTSSKNVNAGASSTDDEIFADGSKIAKDGFISAVTGTKIEKNGPTPEDDSQEFDKGSKSEVTDLKLDGLHSKDSNIEIKISNSDSESLILINTKDGHESIGKATYLIKEHGKIVHNETVSLGPMFGQNRKIIKEGTHSKVTRFEIDKDDPDSQNESLKTEKDDLAYRGEYLKIDKDFNDGSFKIVQGGPNSEENSRNIEKDGPAPEGEFLKIDKDGTGSNDGSFEIVQGGPNSEEDNRNIEKDGPFSRWTA